MAGADLAAVRAAYKEHFTNQTITDIFYRSSADFTPIMAAMEASADNGEGFGRKLVTPIVYGTGSAVGADLTKVQAKANSSTVGASGLYTRWEQDPVTINVTCQWERDAMDAAISRSTKETFKVMAKEMELKIVAARNKLARLAVGDGTGAMATILEVGAGGSAAANWIRVGTDVINRFKRGMDISVAATGGTGACRVTTGGSGQDHLGVLGTDPDTGYVYLDGNPASSASSRDPWIATDVVFDYNDRAAGSLTYVLPQGLKQWLPGATVVDSSPFNGITRNGISELAGLTCNCANLEPENAFMKALKTLKQQAGVKASALFCSDNDWLAYAAGKDKSKMVDISFNGTYNIGFRGLTIEYNGGSCPVVPDSYLPDGEFYAGPWKDSKVCPKWTYTGDLVQIDNKDGLDFRLVDGAAAYRMQMYSRGNISFAGPGQFIRGYGLVVS